MVPEISTLWPTCGVSLLSSASSRYPCGVEPAFAALVAVSAELPFDVTFVKTNLVLESLALLLPLVPATGLPLVPTAI